MLLRKYNHLLEEIDIQERLEKTQEFLNKNLNRFPNALEVSVGDSTCSVLFLADARSPESESYVEVILAPSSEERLIVSSLVIDGEERLLTSREYYLSNLVSQVTKLIRSKKNK